MILFRYFSKRLFKAFASLLIMLTIMLSTQALFSSLKNLELYSLPIENLALLFGLELCAALPLLLNFSFVMGWMSWRRTLEDQHEEHAALVSGWSNAHTRSIAWKSLISLSFINFCLLFLMMPFLTHRVHQIIAESSSSELLKTYRPGTLIRIGDKHILSYKKNIEEGLQDVSIITTNEQQALVLYARQALPQPNNQGLLLKEGYLYHMQSPTDVLHFDSMNFMLSQNAPPKIARAGLTMQELKAKSSSVFAGEIFWRAFLVIQAWIIILGFLNKKIALRKSTAYNRYFIESILLFSLTTATSLAISRLLIQGLNHNTLVPITLLSLITLMGFIRSRIHDQ